MTTCRKTQGDEMDPKIDPLKAIAFHAVLVAGVLAVHFGVVPLW